jgi:protein NrfD
VPDLLLGKAPHWEWLAVGYFFAGGIAGGCHALASAADLFGRGRHRAAANLGYLVALPAVVLGGLLLVVDLERPERFWHMLFMSERFPTPVFKWWSPISVGAWALAVFGAVSTLTFLLALASQGRLRSRLLVRWRDGPVGRIASTLGGLLGLFLAGYTGVLLAVTNRPVWSETDWMGALFLVSGLSASAAVLTLLLRRRAADPLGESRSWLSRFDAWMLGLEAIVLVALVLSLGPAARSTWWNAASIALAVGVVLLGIALPLLLQRGRERPGGLREVWACVAVLVGGFCLRTLAVIPVEAL